MNYNNGNNAPPPDIRQQNPGPSFIAIDVETANENPASICQIGIVQVTNGRIQTPTSQLINPQTPFREFNTNLHGITEAAVQNAPPLPAIYPRLLRQLSNQIIVSHTSFDRAALTAAAAQYHLPPMRQTWLDSARIARQAWPGKYRRRWNLKLIASDLGITFQHHNAAEDARAAAEIILAACRHRRVPLTHWLPSPNRPANRV